MGLFAINPPNTKLALMTSATWSSQTSVDDSCADVADSECTLYGLEAAKTYNIFVTATISDFYSNGGTLGELYVLSGTNTVIGRIEVCFNKDAGLTQSGQNIHGYAQVTGATSYTAKLHICMGGWRMQTNTNGYDCFIVITAIEV